MATEHQHNKVLDENGKEIDNIKFVSYDGHFELIFNGYGELQTIENNPEDMGTFNYYSSNQEELYHFMADWFTYQRWGNTK